MTKRVPIRVRTLTQGGGHARVTGDLHDRDITSGYGWMSTISKWTWLNLQHRAYSSRRLLDITSGKKDKKFWRKVNAEIKKFSPDEKPLPGSDHASRRSRKTYGGARPVSRMNPHHKTRVS